MWHFGHFGLGFVVLVGACAAAAGQTIVDHPPLNTGGPAADTLFLNDFGQTRYQQLADDFFLKTPASIRRLIWWGFYGTDNTPNPQPPAGDETMRVRFYDARTTDGLPGAILREQSFVNPSRVATGRTVFVGAGPAEFRYEADLAVPLDLDAGRTYWVEFVQVLDLNSVFRWEFSVNQPSPSFVFQNTSFPEWRLSTLPGDLAFQLSTLPDVETLFLFLPIAICFSRRRPQQARLLQNGRKLGLRFSGGVNVISQSCRSGGEGSLKYGLLPNSGSKIDLDLLASGVCFRGVHNGDTHSPRERSMSTAHAPVG